MRRTLSFLTLSLSISLAACDGSRIKAEIRVVDEAGAPVEGATLRLSTWHSAMLRTVWEGDQLLEARIVPLFLDRYRPVPAMDGLTADIARRLSEGSLLPATAVRGEDLGIRPTRSDPPEIPLSPGFRLDHGTILLSADPPPASTLTLAADI